MSNFYQAVNWNRQKRIYDTALATGVVLYLALFTATTFALDPNATAETTLIRALGTCALLLLHLILCIGPLCRLNPRFLPLLYNRRHLGVTMFILALAHATFATIQFHALGDVNPLVSILIGSADARRVSQFPFELAGVAALGILFLMAATSHDFWLANLTAPVWKALHMLVYVAYGLLIAHVSLGALQSETDPLLAILLATWRAARARPPFGCGIQGKATGQRTSPGRQRWLCRGLRGERHPGGSGQDRAGERRANRGVSLRRKDFLRLQCLPAPERPTRRRPHRGWLHHLSMARLHLPARHRCLSATFYREDSHLQRAGAGGSGVCGSQAQCAGDAGGAGDCGRKR